MPLSDEQIRQARAVSTQAVIVLGRTAGEDQDNADVEGGYRLTADEKHMLHQVCREFDEVAVVLNTAGLIDLSWADDPLLRQRIRALLYVWHGGAHGAQAAASLLYGDVTPSGKLVGSIVISLDDHPASPCWGAEEKISTRKISTLAIAISKPSLRRACSSPLALVSHTPLSPCNRRGRRPLAT